MYVVFWYLISLLQLFLFILFTAIFMSFPVIDKTEKNSNHLNKVHFQKKLDYLKTHDLYTDLIFLLNLLESIFHNGIMVNIFWITGFISWILGSSFWVLNGYFQSSIFIGISLLFCFLAFYKTIISKSYVVSFSENKRGFSPLYLIISISVLTMIIQGSIAVGLTLNIILMIALFNWKIITK